MGFESNATFAIPSGFDPFSLAAEDRPVRLGLMGGTFDPIHVGHLACAEAACEACGVEKVLFLPAGDPNFKQGRHLAPAEKRLAWCEAVLAGHPRFAACDIEVSRKGATYTIDTLHQLRAMYPANVELCFIMGADSASTLLRWHKSEALPPLATYIVVSRPGQPFGEEERAALCQAGFVVEYVDSVEVDVSSTEIRARLAAGESVKGLVPDVVCAEVEMEPAYYCSALSEEFFETRKNELAQRVSPKRFAHIMGVVDACERLAHAYGVDARMARLAGLLHDWDKGYDDAGIRARALELGLAGTLDAWVIDNMPQVLHAHTAARALAREFPHIPEEIIRAIDRHTTAAIDMSPLEMVLYVADAIEDGRQFGRIDELRAAVGQVSLEELFFFTYEYWVLLLFERRKQLHPDTIAIWNTLVARRAARKGNE